MNFINASLAYGSTCINMDFPPFLGLKRIGLGLGDTIVAVNQSERVNVKH